MTITQTRHLRFRRRQISRWRRRWSKTNGVIGFFLLLFFPPRYELAVAYLSIRFTHSSTLYNGIAACATLGYIYVGGMPMCVPHSIAPPVAHYNNVSLCLLFVIPNIIGSLHLCIKPGPPACQSDALTTTLPGPRVEVWNVGTIEVGSHSTSVPNSTRKWHSIHILVVVYNAMYMAYTTLWLVFNFSSFPPWPMKIEVWPVFKLNISTGLHHYLDTIPRTDKRVIAINIGLKRSNDLALVSRGISIKCVLCDLYYVSYIIAERLAGGCPCILVP